MIIWMGEKNCSLSQRIHKIAGTMRNARHLAKALPVHFLVKDGDGMPHLVQIACCWQKEKKKKKVLRHQHPERPSICLHVSQVAHCSSTSWLLGQSKDLRIHKLTSTTNMIFNTAARTNSSLTAHSPDLYHTWPALVPPSKGFLSVIMVGEPLGHAEAYIKRRVELCHVTACDPLGLNPFHKSSPTSAMTLWGGGWGI